MSADAGQKRRTELILRALLEDDEDEDDIGFKDLATPLEKVYLKLGFLTHHLDEADLIEEFLDLLKTVNPEKAELWRDTWEDSEYDESYLAYELLPDVLQKYAPPFAYFGQYESDSDWGVWANREKIEEALEDEPEMLKAWAKDKPLPEFPVDSKFLVLMNRDDYPEILLDGQTGQKIWRVNY
jgi:hypothetical protein